MGMKCNRKASINKAQENFTEHFCYLFVLFLLLLFCQDDEKVLGLLAQTSLHSVKGKCSLPSVRKVLCYPTQFSGHPPPSL